MSKFDSIESSYKILLVTMLHIWNLRYFKHFWIINRIGLESIIFAINLDATLFSKVFNIFDFVFLSIVLLTRTNKFISLKKLLFIFNIKFIIEKQILILLLKLHINFLTLYFLVYIIFLKYLWTPHFLLLCVFHLKM